MVVIYDFTMPYTFFSIHPAIFVNTKRTIVPFPINTITAHAHALVYFPCKTQRKMLQIYYEYVCKRRYGKTCQASSLDSFDSFEFE